MFCEKYKPTRLQDFIGNRNAIIQLDNWLLNWTAIAKSKASIISGKTGIGKSLLAELVAKKYQYCITNIGIEIENATTRLNNLVSTPTNILQKKNILIIDDIDTADAGFITCVIECIKKTAIPIIITCNDYYAKNIKTLTAHCFSVKLYSTTFEQIQSFATNVIKQEKLKITKGYAIDIFAQSNGDIRFFLNNLQTLDTNNPTLYKSDNTTENNKDIQSNTIFDTTQLLLSQEHNIETKWQNYIQNEEMHFHFLHDNYINNICNNGNGNGNGKGKLDILNNLSSASNCFSDSIQIQNSFHFELTQYIIANNIRATTFCKKKTNIVFPKFMQKKEKQKDIDFVSFFNNNNSIATLKTHLINNGNDSSNNNNDNQKTNGKKIIKKIAKNTKNTKNTKITKNIIQPISPSTINCNNNCNNNSTSPSTINCNNNCNNNSTSSSSTTLPTTLPTKPKLKKLPKDAKIRKSQDEIKNSNYKYVIIS